MDARSISSKKTITAHKHKVDGSTIARSFATYEPLVLSEVSINLSVSPVLPSDHLDPQDYARWRLVHCMPFSWHICNNIISYRLWQSSILQMHQFAHEIIKYW